MHFGFGFGLGSTQGSRNGGAPSLLVLASPPSTGQVNTRFTDFVVAAEGGTRPYRFELIGGWPEGLTVHPTTGRVFGSSTEAGTFADLKVKATDAKGVEGETQPFTLVILAENVSALDPFAASVQPNHAYGMRKIRVGYAGNAGRVRNSGGGGPFNIPFDANGIADQVTLAGVTGPGWSDLYDQIGSAHFASTSRPSTTLDAQVNRAGQNVPAINYSTNIQNMVTTATPLNFDAGKCVVVFMVERTMGWSSAGQHARNPAVFSNANGPLLGYGSGSALGLIYGAYGQAGETVWRAGNGQTYIEEGTPDDTRFRNIWYRYDGQGRVSGGIGNKLIFADRPQSAIAQSGPQRMVLGAHGNQTQAHNGHIYEMIVFVGDAAPSIEECMRIAMWQREWWGDLETGIRRRRFRALGGGQSLMQFYGTAASFSGSGTAADYADQRVFRPDILSYLNPTSAADITVTHTFNSSAIGGSALYNTVQTTPDAGGGTSWAAWDGSTEAKKFWWDQFNNIPGPCLQSWRNNAVFAGAGFDPTVLMWDQGQANALTLSGGESANNSFAIYEATLQKVFNQQRAWLGQDAPILIQPYGRQSGSAGIDTAGRRIREIQEKLSKSMKLVFIGTEMCDLTRQDSVHPAAGPADPNGFDLAAHRLARGAAYYLGDLDVTYRGPEVLGARFVSATTIDVDIVFPEGAGGTDIAPSADIVGFSVTGKAVTSVARLDADTIRITGTGFAPGDLVQHNTNPSGLDRTKMVVDNFTLPMPLRQAWDVVAA